MTKQKPAIPALGCEDPSHAALEDEMSALRLGQVSDRHHRRRPVPGLNCRNWLLMSDAATGARLFWPNAQLVLAFPAGLASRGSH
jgi:hypothetical protein